MFLDIGDMAKKKLEMGKQDKGLNSESGTSRNLISEDGNLKKKKKCCWLFVAIFDVLIDKNMNTELVKKILKNNEKIRW